MRSRARFAGPRRLLAGSLAVTLVPAGLLVWLGLELHRRDQILENQYVQDRLTQAADLVVSGLREAILKTQRELHLPRGKYRQPAEDTAVVTWDGESIELQPRNRLAYSPIPSHMPADAPGMFPDAGELDLLKEPEKAIGAYRRLASGGRPEFRAGALIRLDGDEQESERESESEHAHPVDRAPLSSLKTIGRPVPPVNKS